MPSQNLNRAYGYLWWLNGGSPAMDAMMHRWPLGGGPAELLSPIGGFDLALDASHLYVAGSPLACRIPKSRSRRASRVATSGAPGEVTRTRNPSFGDARCSMANGAPA